jgi:hypothetical protein
VVPANPCQAGFAHLAAAAGAQALLAQRLAPDVLQQALVAGGHRGRHRVVPAPPRQPLHDRAHLGPARGLGLGLGHTRAGAHAPPRCSVGAAARSLCQSSQLARRHGDAAGAPCAPQIKSVRRRAKKIMRDPGVHFLPALLGTQRRRPRGRHAHGPGGCRKAATHAGPRVAAAWRPPTPELPARGGRQAQGVRFVARLQVRPSQSR